MPIYKFSALDKSWKRERGTIEAEDADRVEKILRERGLRPESIRAVHFQNVGKLFATARRRPLLALLTIGLPLAPLLVLALRRRKKMQAVEATEKEDSSK